MAQTIIDLLNKGIKANKEDTYRQGNIINLPQEGSLVISGDIHGHRRNFEKIIKFSQLENNPDKHLILQEIIHGGSQDEQGNCTSYKVLFDAVKYKLKFPNQVHFIMGNHDTAFITDSEVIKDGKEMNRSMRKALEREFQEDYTSIELAMSQFLLSQPLAAKCCNKIFISHSLPNYSWADEFDPSVLEREIDIDDLIKPGSAYLLTWGRKHNKKLLEKMSQKLHADFFILAHQPQEKGYIQPEENLIIFTSEHNHGCIMLIDLKKNYTTEELIKAIIPISAIS